MEDYLISQNELKRVANYFGCTAEDIINGELVRIINRHERDEYADVERQVDEINNEYGINIIPTMHDLKCINDRYWSCADSSDFNDAIKDLAISHFKEQGYQIED